jgi:CspA family cold shock protein
MSERIVGTVKRWIGERGFGFLTCENGPDVFLHANRLEAAGISEPEVGDRIEFELVDGRAGRQEAGELRRVYD